MIRAACRDLADGEGKPEPLRDDWAGFGSRRITDKHRLVYEPTNGYVRFVRARGHYGRRGR